MHKRTYAALAVLAIIGSTAAWLTAQASVTIHFRNGDTLPAMLVDLKADGFELLVRGESRMIPTDQVGMVDFGPPVTVPAGALQNLSPADHLIVFRNGDTMLGQWLDVGGTSPLRLTIRGAGGERDLTSNEVARIYLARPSNIDAGDGSGGGGMQEDGAIRVDAAQLWTDTSMQVRSGEYLRFDVTRAIRIDNSGGTVTADGVSGAGARPRGLPVPIMPRGGLIGRVGSGQPFAIGTAPEPIRMPANGRLWLGINELDVADNSGWFRVVISRGR